MKTKLLLVATLLCIILSYSQKTHVPDNNFEQALIDLGYDDVLDNYVLTSEIEKITKFSINASDYTGLEAFINLRSLSLSVGQYCYHTIDLSKMLHLEKLSVEIDKSNMPDISKNLALKEIKVTTNDTTARLDLKNHLALEKLSVNNNRNGSANFLDLSNHTKLQEVSVDRIEGLNLSNCNALESVSIGNCFEGINLTNCTALKILCFRYRGSSFNNLDLSTCTSLESIRIENNNRVENLDLSKNTNLKSVYLRDLFKLESLDLKNGNNTNTEVTLRVLPKLTCVTVDDAAYSTANWSILSGTTYSEDCKGKVLATDEFNLKGFVMYPNPVKNKLQVSIKEEANYILVNTNGQIIFKGQLTFGKNLLDVSRLANGVYYLNIKTDNVTTSKKVIKY